MKNKEKKMFYFLIGCISLSLLIVGATYAYFTASTKDENTVKGDAATVTFGLTVEKITTADMAFGLVPMRNKQAPNAARRGCHDDFGNAGCQMYKITINADSDTVMFLDGYISITPKDERLETRFANVYTDDGEQNFYTKFTKEDFLDNDLLNESYLLDLGIKTGVRQSDGETPLNRTDDFNCLLLENEKIGGDVGRQKIFYMMIWVYDNGEAQDYLQGMQLAYQGEVTFATAEGNEISATFD